LNDCALYGLEVLSESNSACFIGPEFIDPDSRDLNMFHVYINKEILRTQRCERISCINFLVTSIKHKINYGNNGDVFNQSFPDLGQGHCFKYPDNAKSLDGSVFDWINHAPTQEEELKIKWGDYSSYKNQSNTLANRIHHSNDTNRNMQNNNGPWNQQPNNEENKNGGILMDFSNDFMGNSKHQPKFTRNNPPTNSRFGSTNTRGGMSGSNNQFKSNIPNPSKNAAKRNTARTFGTPIVKTTKSTELRIMMNRDKNNAIGRSHTNNLPTIRESEKGKNFN